MNNDWAPHLLCDELLLEGFGVAGGRKRGREKEEEKEKEEEEEEDSAALT